MKHYSGSKKLETKHIAHEILWVKILGKNLEGKTSIVRMFIIINLGSCPWIMAHLKNNTKQQIAKLYKPILLVVISLVAPLILSSNPTLHTWMKILHPINEISLSHYVCVYSSRLGCLL
jgi:hypothetical protein